MEGGSLSLCGRVGAALGAECTGREMGYDYTGRGMSYDYNRDAELALCTRSLGRSWGELYTGVRAGAWEGWGMERQHGLSAFTPFIARWNDREGGLDESCGETNAEVA